jgi:hypothetical protein
MKILLLNHNVVERSTFYRAFYFGRELADWGHEVTLATVSRRNVLRPVVGLREGVRVIETPDLGVSLARTGWDSLGHRLAGGALLGRAARPGARV